jgi:purine-nucleoside phosphorylase
MVGDMMLNKETTAEEAAAKLAKLFPVTPVAAVVLGSGVSLLENLREATSISFQELFGLSPQVQGHAGTATLGFLDHSGRSVPIAVFRGRFHLYEGHPWSTVTLATATIIARGIKNLLLTNAAGGLNLQFNVGDLMVISGFRDLLNPQWKETGLVKALAQTTNHNCANELSAKVQAIGAQLAKQDPSFTALKEGVYAGVLGPSYETMAEITMLRKLGADAVGMSTIPELLTCEGSLTKACAVSVITNVWKPQEEMGGHAEVLEASKAASTRLDKLFRELLVSL